MLRWGHQKRLFVYDWPVRDVIKSFAPLAGEPYSLLLDSARRHHPLARYSYICWHPFETVECFGNRVTVTNRDHQVCYTADPFQVVRERLNMWGEGIKTKRDLPPFQGGAAGYFGYDLCRTLEKISEKDGERQPDLCIGFYDKIIAFDHQADKAFLMIYAEDSKSADIHKKYLEEMIGKHKEQSVFSGLDTDWKTKRSDGEYMKDIERVIEYIYAGDIFQANLSRRFTAKIPDDFDSFSHYVHMRKINPAPYAAYMNFGDVRLASCSPERFLSVQGRHVETRPVKGTLPSTSPSESLSMSEKDRSENIMIVDLLRNDLSKVCEDHSIEVSSLCATETFEGLHHMVSTIKGVLRADQMAMDALRACFPGGSVTGAPKIRAMQIINELEPDRRGPYCGAIGYCGFNGTMDTAITIRTLVYEGRNVHLQTGSGITAGSDSKAELSESLDKAQKIFESFAPSSSFSSRGKA